MKHYPMPERYRVILDYLSPKALRHTFKKLQDNHHARLYLKEKAKVN